MADPRRTLFGRISLTMFGLLILLSAVQLGILNVIWTHFIYKSEQQLNWSAAADLGRDLASAEKTSVSGSSLLQFIRDWTESNPRIDVYLIDTEGRIVADFGDGDTPRIKSVDIGAVKKFLAPAEERETPIYGTDPRDPKQPTVFSAAPYSWENRSGYLYLVLLNRRYANLTRLFKQAGVMLLSASATGAAVLVVGLLGVFAFYRLTKRIRSLIQIVERYTAGELSARAVVTRDDELGTLGSTMNEMADSIENAMRELGKRDALRRELIANVSHDLRGPVGVLTSYLDLIARASDAPQPAHITPLIETMSVSLKSLRRLLEELFELAKLEAKEITPNREPFQASSLLDDICLAYQRIAEKKEIALVAVYADRLPEIDGDIALLSRAMTNILENALRHTPPGGQISLSAAHDGALVRLSVTDTGAGIPEEKLPLIFQKFYQGDDPANNHGGAGLGLAIVRSIIEAHGSTIDVSSAAGHGTTFSFSLPRAALETQCETAARPATV